MKTLVVFYSLEGNTKFIAQIVADQLQADILELETKKAYPSEGFKKYFWGGKSVFFKEQPELTNKNIDLSNYDTLVVGTPVWAGSFAPPINTFLNQYKFEHKKVALFACHGGGGAEKCFAKLKEALATNEFIGKIDFLDPLKHNKEEISKEAAQWATKLSI